MIPKIQKITRVPLREIFKHEAQDFTKWLEDNLDVLNEVLDISLSNAEREASAGEFRVDLVAIDEGGAKVIIENQLEKSNHDHLGKLITYLVAMDARTAIWIVSDPRPEHISAITWLNESSSSSFYLIKLETIKIADSEPAALFTLIVGPSDYFDIIGMDKLKDKVESSKGHELKLLFSTSLLKYANDKTTLHSGVSPSKTGRIRATAGKPGLGYAYGVGLHESFVELYIDYNKDSAEKNKTENDKFFNLFFSHKLQIESDAGFELEWHRVDNNRHCKIRKSFSLGGYKDEQQWQDIIEKMVDAMIQLEKAFTPHI